MLSCTVILLASPFALMKPYSAMEWVMADDQSSKHHLAWDPALVEWLQQHHLEFRPDELVRRSFVNRAMKTVDAAGNPRNHAFLKAWPHRALEDDECAALSRCAACQAALDAAVEKG